MVPIVVRMTVVRMTVVGMGMVGLSGDIGHQRAHLIKYKSGKR